MRRRRKSDVVRLVLGVIALLLSMGFASEERVPAWEVDVFRLVNDLPGALYPVVWPLMQFGTFISIPLATVVALAFRRWRLAIVIAVSGVGVYYLAKVVKDVVVRLRPGVLLEDVHLRGIGTLGLGFPSGHAAVSAALAVAISAYVTRGWRRVLVALAVFVNRSRGCTSAGTCRWTRSEGPALASRWRPRCICWWVCRPRR